VKSKGNPLKTTNLLLISTLGLALLRPAFAQDAQPAAAKPEGDAAVAPPAKPKPTREELEAKFTATMTKATFNGRWCAIKDGHLGPQMEDKYTIVGVKKLGGDTWIITARIQYGKQDIAAPIPVQVKWAGDTPVITLDNVGIPGGAAYTARVLVYGSTYAGTWSGGDHGGLLSGLITNQKE
jgi:hypothetical protein